VLGDGSVLDRIVARAARMPRRILFPDTEGEALREALTRLVAARIVEPCVRPTSTPGDLPDGVTVLDDGEHADGVLTRSASPAAAFDLVELAVPTEAGERVLLFVTAGASSGAVALAGAARAAAAQFRLLCESEPRVALLSFSTHGSARHRGVDMVREALDIARDEDPTLQVGGELQGDAALVPAVAASKAPGDPVAGRANVLVFPDRDSADIGRALTGNLAGATLAGPFSCATARPVNSLSRCDSADAIVVTAAVTALQAG